MIKNGATHFASASCALLQAHIFQEASRAEKRANNSDLNKELFLGDLIL